MHVSLCVNITLLYKAVTGILHSGGESDLLWLELALCYFVTCNITAVADWRSVTCFYLLLFCDSELQPSTFVELHKFKSSCLPEFLR